MNCHEQREIVEAIVTLLLSDERGSIIPLSFLLGMLKIRITIDMEISYMHELERRIGQQLKSARLDDMLKPSIGREESIYDVITVCRILTLS